MRDIKILREEIDRIDSEIVSLIEERYNISKEVAEFKRKNNIEVLDAAREDAVIFSRKEKLNNHEYDEYISALYKKIMEQSRDIQLSKISESSIKKTDLVQFKKCPKVCYCGVKGSYAAQGVEIFFDGDYEEISTDSFEEAFRLVENNDCDYAVIPIENSSTGSINDVYDLLFKYNFKICGEVNVRIDHVLVGKKGTELGKIKKIYSHIQGLNQCEEFLSTFKEAEKIPFYNTAGAAKFVSESDDLTIAAIASKKTADIYGLEILKEDISIRKNNFTRFVVISKNGVEIKDADKISMAFTLHHSKGSLYKVLSVFAKENLNLVKIESRPCEDKNWEYLFFLDFILDKEISIESLLEKIKPMTKEMEYLGNYRSYHG